MAQLVEKSYELEDQTFGYQIELSDDELERVGRLAQARLTIPVMEIVAHRWTTSDGYEIVRTEHRQEYPPLLRVPGIVPGTLLEERGWPCPHCGGTDTSTWTNSADPGRRLLQCHYCTD